MNIEASRRLQHFQTGIFAALNEKKDALVQSGKKVYNLSVGTPDFPVAEHVKQALIKAAENPEKTSENSVSNSSENSSAQ